jgi:copper resistance protein C
LLSQNRFYVVYLRWEGHDSLLTLQLQETATTFPNDRRCAFIESMSNTSGRLHWRAGVVALAVALLLILPHAALAHAVLVKSSPAQGATVKTGDLEITLTYNSRIDAPHSSLHLIGPEGKERTLAVDEHASPNLMVSKAAGLTAGAYKLQWQVQASDGHISRGVVAFRVA